MPNSPSVQAEVPQSCHSTSRSPKPLPYCMTGCSIVEVEPLNEMSGLLPNRRAKTEGQRTSWP